MKITIGLLLVLLSNFGCWLVSNRTIVALKPDQHNILFYPVLETGNISHLNEQKDNIMQYSITHPSEKISATSANTEPISLTKVTQNFREFKRGVFRDFLDSGNMFDNNVSGVKRHQPQPHGDGISSHAKLESKENHVSGNINNCWEKSTNIDSCCRGVKEGKFFCLFEHDPFESENEHRNNPSVNIVFDAEKTEGNDYLTKTIQRPDKLELIKLSDIDEAIHENIEIRL